MLRAEGSAVGQRQVQRLRRAESLRVPPTKRKQVRRGHSTGLPTRAMHRGHVWTWNFIADATVRGGALRMLTVLDAYTRGCHVLRADRALKFGDVMRLVQEAIEQQQHPEYIRSGNGSEFIAKELQQWLAEQKIRTIYIEPASPLAERLRGVIPRPLPRRVPQPRATVDPHRGPHHHRGLPHRLQYPPAAQSTRLPQPGALRSPTYRCPDSGRPPASLRRDSTNDNRSINP